MSISLSCSQPYPSFETRTSTVFDKASVASSAFFATDISAALRDFYSQHCVGRTLARWLIAENGEQLRMAMNVNLPHTERQSIPMLIGRNPALMGAPNMGRIAQMICVGENAGAMVRVGSSMKFYVVKGSPDPAELTLSGFRFRLVGFRVDVRLPDRPHEIRLYLSSGTLPDVTTAERTTRHLEGLLGLRVLSYFRTTGSFFDVDGPANDVFQEPLNIPTVNEFLSSPLVLCWPGDGVSRCKYLMSPTAARDGSEAWGR